MRRPGSPVPALDYRPGLQSKAKRPGWRPAGRRPARQGAATNQQQMNEVTKRRGDQAAGPPPLERRGRARIGANTIRARPLCQRLNAFQEVMCGIAAEKGPCSSRPVSYRCPECPAGVVTPVCPFPRTGGVRGQIGNRTIAIDTGITPDLRAENAVRLVELRACLNKITSCPPHLDLLRADAAGGSSPSTTYSRSAPAQLKIRRGRTTKTEPSSNVSLALEPRNGLRCAPDHFAGRPGQRMPPR